MEGEREGRKEGGREGERERGRERGSDTAVTNAALALVRCHFTQLATTITTSFSFSSIIQSYTSNLRTAIEIMVRSILEMGGIFA